MLDLDPRWHIDADGGVVQNGLDPCLHQLICHLLRHRGRDGQHGDLDARLADLIHDGGGILDHEVTRFLSHFGCVIIEHHSDVESAVRKPLIAREGVSHIAHADQRHVPDAVNLEDGFQPLEQERDVVPGPLLAEFAEL